MVMLLVWWDCSKINSRNNRLTTAQTMLHKHLVVAKSQLAQPACILAVSIHNSKTCFSL